VNELTLGREPRLWIQGHSHDSREYMLETTRVICAILSSIRWSTGIQHSIQGLLWRWRS